MAMRKHSRLSGAPDNDRRGVRKGGLVVLLLGLALVTAWVSTRTFVEEPKGRQEPLPHAQPAEQTPVRELSRTARVSTPSEPSPRAREAPRNRTPGAPNYFVPLQGADAHDLVKVFDFNLQYPPGSRPAFKQNEYQMNPDFRRQSGTLEPLAPTPPDPGFAYELAVYDQNIGPGETFMADLTVLRDGTPVEFQIDEMKVVNDSVEPPSQLTPPTSTRLADEVSGAAQYARRIRWQATGTAREYWGSLLLLIIVNTQNGRYAIPQAIESTPMQFARFTRNFGERLQRGSLYVDVEIEASREVWCEISGRLYDAEEPTHVASWTGPIKTGKQVVPLEFFGKIFHDMGFVEGRLQLRQLQGKCMNVGFPIDLLTRIPESEEEVARLAEDRAAAMARPKGAADPSLLEMEALPVAHTTENYRIEQFSDAVWDSPEKQARRSTLVRIQESRAQLALGGPQ
jgi:hypothetical protein